MTLEQIKRERALLESRMTKMVELFEKKTGQKVSKVSYGMTTITHYNGRKVDGSWEVFVSVLL